MKVGLIFECGPMGADKQVCEHLAKQLCPEWTFVSRTMDNKLNLLEGAANVAKRLLKEDGCNKVLIIWDLRPAWPDKKDKPCRANERKILLKGLGDAGLQNNCTVYLVCIEQELESWLLACEHAISTFLSTPAHPYKAKAVKKPDREQQPKAIMNNHFQQAKGYRYEDRLHALKVLKADEFDVKRLRRSVSFMRFETKLLTQ